MLNEKGRENYKPPLNFDMTQRQASPTRQIKTSDTLKSTASSTSGGGASAGAGGGGLATTADSAAKMRNPSTESMIQRPLDHEHMYVTNEIEFEDVNRIHLNNEEEEEEDEDEEGEGEEEGLDDDESASWNHNHKKRRGDNGDGDEEEESSADSGGFRKPVDFGGFDKETSAKLDKLDLKLMVGGKEGLVVSSSQPPQAGVESAPTSSREPLDSPTRNHVKAILGQKYGKIKPLLKINN